MPSRKELFAYGKMLGLSPDQVVRLIRSAGWDSVYREDLHDEYINLLSGWGKRRDALMEKVKQEDFTATENISVLAERVLRKVGEREWYFSPIAHNPATGEYRNASDGVREGEELVYAGVTVEDFISLRS